MNAHELSDRLGLDGHERLFVMLYWTERLTIAEAAAVLGVSNYAAECLRRKIVGRARRIVAAEADEHITGTPSTNRQ